MIENIVTLLMLIALQSVLGFDNLLAIAIESKNAPLDKQPMVRKWGIGLAIVFRMGLLFALVKALPSLQKIVWTVSNPFIDGSFHWHSIIVIGGGLFIIYTAMKEITHMMVLEKDGTKKKKPQSVLLTISLIVLMNVIFSIDSILSAMVMTDVFWVMAVAILISGLFMMLVADGVSNFLKKHRKYEVLGLFILLNVGILLITEGGELAHLSLFGEHIEPMNMTTFYFVIGAMICLDIVQGLYDRKVNIEEATELGNTEHSTGDFECPYCETTQKEKPEDLLKGSSQSSVVCSTCKNMFSLIKETGNKYITKTF